MVKSKFKKLANNHFCTAFKEFDISSEEFYKQHNSCFFCSATIKAGKILSLYSERGREGGEIWAPNHSVNDDLQYYLSSLGRDFGMKFYHAVYKAAYNEKLKTSKATSAMHKHREIDLAEKEVAEARRKYLEAQGKLKKLKGIEVSGR